MMNRYTDLSNTSKASILCRLFPSEIPAVLEFIAQQNEALLADPARFKMQHDTCLFSFERLMDLSKEVKACLKNARRKDAAGLFISLFNGYRACYTGQLLIRYLAEIEPKHEMFALAVSMLFMIQQPVRKQKP